MPKKAKGNLESKQTPRRGHHRMDDSFAFEAEDSVPVNIPSFIHPRYTRHFGNHLPFYWNGDEPKFTIGPHCNSSCHFLFRNSHHRANFCDYLVDFDWNNGSSDILSNSRREYSSG